MSGEKNPLNSSADFLINGRENILKSGLSIAKVVVSQEQMIFNVLDLN